jgi:tRNA(adenine34) deaminase
MPTPDGIEQADIEFMRQAIEEAKEGSRTPGGAQVGCVVVKDGLARCEAFNEGDLRHDPTAHAEMVSIRRLCAELKTTSLAGFTLYCTLQPCGMCTMACLWAGVSRVVYGAGRNDVNSVYFESRHSDTIDFIHQAFRDDLKVKGGVLAHECSQLYLKPNDLPPKDEAHQPTTASR